LAHRLGFKVQEKNQGDKRRLQKFAEYLGPDHDTLALLTTYANKWFYQPLQFWDHSSTVAYDILVDPQAQIYQAFLQSTHDHA
jgi:hypothetical protein